MPTTTETTTTGRLRRSPLIKGLAPGLPERGKIKIGRKGAMIESRGGSKFQPPQKLDHFLITTLDRGPDGNFVRDDAIHKTLGEKPTRIPITLLFDDIALNLQSRYACFKGRSVWCTGDGDRAERMLDGGGVEIVECTCERIEPGYKGSDACKFNCTLSCIIRGAPGLGGVWKLRSTSYHTTVGLMSSLSLIKSASGGVLRGLELDLVLNAKQATAPDGKQQTIYVVAIEFAGDLDDLKTAGIEAATANAHQVRSIRDAEREARELIEQGRGAGVFPGEDPNDIVEEFYHEQVGGTDPGAEEWELVDQHGEAHVYWSPQEFTDAMVKLLTDKSASADDRAAIREHNADAVRALHEGGHSKMVQTINLCTETPETKPTGGKSKKADKPAPDPDPGPEEAQGAAQAGDSATGGKDPKEGADGDPGASSGEQPGEIEFPADELDAPDVRIELKGGVDRASQEDWLTWMRAMRDAVQNAESPATLARLQEAHETELKTLKARGPNAHAKLIQIFGERETALNASG